MTEAPAAAVLSAAIEARVLPRYPGFERASVQPLGGGLINRTFLVTAEGAGRAVLQKVNPIFNPAIHANIHAVTERLVMAGMITPRLLPTSDGDYFLDLGGEVWRMMTHVDGVAFEVATAPEQAHAAGTLIGRFHRTLEDLPHRFQGMRQGVHDTGRHLARLQAAVAAHPGHRLARIVGPLAAAIDAARTALPPLPELPDRVCHGDPKFNNVLFAGHDWPASEQALCLIDLDTVGPMKLAHELGDAWRSWCNRGGEDQPHAQLDLEIFRASFAGYRAGLQRPLSTDERRALLLGVEWVSLELAARFAADALEEAYFGWDPQRFPTRGDHNLVRAQSQWSLHQALVASRPDRARTLDSP